MAKVLTDARSIRIKGRSFLAVVLSPEKPIADWLVRLDDLAARSAGFFLGRPIVLDISELEINKAELKALIADLGERGVRIMGVEGGRPSLLSDPGMPPAMQGGRPASDVEVPAAGSSVPAEKAAAAAAVPLPVEAAVRPAAASIVIREPVRSGQSIIFPDGDVTVIGSVSSGAEIIAGGSIHVYGALRGRALAGSVGNATSRIFCQKLEAELLAIDGIYKTADDLPPELKGQPAQLWLDDEKIIAEKL
jgi:septum site-determining protein MinC